MKKMIPWILMALLCVLITGCGSEKKQESSESVAPAIEESVVETPESSPGAEESKPTGEEAFKIAQEYVGKNLDELVEKIGPYQDLQTSDNCEVEGELNAIVTYDGFILACQSQDSQSWWMIMGVREQKK